MQELDLSRHWNAQSAALARRVNLGWWLQNWLPMLLAVCLAGAACILTLRTLAVIHAPWSWIVIGGAMLVSMLAAWLLARRRFESKEQARVRLEDALGLKTRLTAAASGVGSWPAPMKAPRIVTWQWQRPVAFATGGAALLLLAIYVPVSVVTPPKPRLIEKPTAVKEVEKWIEELRKDQALDPKSLEEVEKKIDDLMRRPNDQWYEHASLEAAEHLRDETGRNLQELGAQLEQTQGSMSTLAELGRTMGAEAKSGLAQQLKDNLQSLRSGALGANSDLMEQLKNMDPKALSGMSKEQMQKLAERLKQNADALRKALANAPEFHFKECPCKKPGDGDGDGDGPGKGGIQRGRGDAELTTRKEETNLNQTRTETAQTMIDPERIAPGDLLGLQDAKPNTDQQGYQGPQSGGALKSTGEGGAAVERATLVPSERAALKRFFK